MEFKFNVNDIFKTPIVEINQSLIPPGFTGDRRALWDAVQKVSDVVNSMGDASAVAQGLTKPITTAERLRNADHTIYLLVDKNAKNGRGAVTGMLKTGKKNLYIFDRDGQHYQVAPSCVLDFYVHESRQRMGLGKQLFEHMLQKEKVEPVKLAVDRPSDKLLSFLDKHYGLNDSVRQMNNYVVFNGFFPEQSQANKDQNNGDSVESSPMRTVSANGLQQSFSSPYGRYGAPRPASSMGQLIHNQSPVQLNEPTGTPQPSPRVTQSSPLMQQQWQQDQDINRAPPNICQSAPNMPNQQAQRSIDPNNVQQQQQQYYGHQQEQPYIQQTNMQNQQNESLQSPIIEQSNVQYEQQFQQPCVVQQTHMQQQQPNMQQPDMVPQVQIQQPTVVSHAQMYQQPNLQQAPVLSHTQMPQSPTASQMQMPQSPIVSQIQMQQPQSNMQQQPTIIPQPHIQQQPNIPQQPAAIPQTFAQPHHLVSQIQMQQPQSNMQQKPTIIQQPHIQQQPNIPQQPAAIPQTFAQPHHLDMQQQPTTVQQVHIPQQQNNMLQQQQQQQQSNIQPQQTMIQQTPAQQQSRLREQPNILIQTNTNQYQGNVQQQIKHQSVKKRNAYRSRNGISPQKEQENAIPDNLPRFSHCKSDKNPYARFDLQTQETQQTPVQGQLTPQNKLVQPQYTQQPVKTVSQSCLEYPPQVRGAITTQNQPKQMQNMPSYQQIQHPPNIAQGESQNWQFIPPTDTHLQYDGSAQMAPQMVQTPPIQQHHPIQQQPIQRQSVPTMQAQQGMHPTQQQSTPMLRQTQSDRSTANTPRMQYQQYIQPPNTEQPMQSRDNQNYTQQQTNVQTNMQQERVPQTPRVPYQYYDSSAQVMQTQFKPQGNIPQTTSNAQNVNAAGDMQPLQKSPEYYGQPTNMGNPAKGEVLGTPRSQRPTPRGEICQQQPASPHLPQDESGQMSTQPIHPQGQHFSGPQIGSH